ncbi:hypothetical protein PQX77_007969 [Marasmius sp. AFHP31]|nr:hypothetical protein PQX77_007969 [Marasmius sp. AFHP31]
MELPFLGLRIDLVKALSAALVILVVDRVVAFQRKRRCIPLGIRLPTRNPMCSLPDEPYRSFYKDEMVASGVEFYVGETAGVNNETITSIPWLIGAPVLYTTNIEVMRQVISVSVGQGQTRSTFIKSPDSVIGAGLYGGNVFTTEGDEWRKHRRIVGPAFGNSLYQLVWDQSVQTYRDMVAGEGWAGKKSVEVEKLQDATFKFALIVLGICAFGFDFNWTSPLASPGGDMSVQEAMRTVIDNWIFILFAPGWVKSLPFPSFKHTLKAYTQLELFMQEQVKLRREEIRGHASGEYRRRDAFSMLVQANEADENAKNNLSDRDLIGNVFVMLFAGHETTAHTLAATLALLAVTPDAQDEVVKQIIDVVGWDRDPEFGDYHNLNKVLAAFFEALRLFPAAYILIREPSEDFVLDIPNPRGQEGTQPCPLPKGTWTLVDMIGLQRNPRYFEDPEEYKPSRWHTMPNDSELFTGFNFGEDVFQDLSSLLHPLRPPTQVPVHASEENSQRRKL